MKWLSLSLAALMAYAPMTSMARSPRRPNRRIPAQQQLRLPQQNEINFVDLGNIKGVVDAGPGATIHTPFTGPLTATKVRDAIEDAVLFLRSQQQPDGQIGAGHYANGGPTALATLALLAAGANPASDRDISRALDWLLKLKPDNTYVRAIRANVWEYALRKAPYDTRFREALRLDFEWLQGALNDEGWRYTAASRDWDNSCTQYGVLGLWAASRAGFTPKKGFWAKMSRHFRKSQNSDGGWGYVQGSPSTPNMATAGLASLFLVFDMHHGRGAYSRTNPRTFQEGDAAAVLKALDRGMHWLGESKGSKDNSYYLYGMERTGVASGLRLIGGEDWFERGALSALTRQGPDGAINMGYGPVISTALTTLFLVYGGAPVAFNKLRYGEGQSWNLNPRDVANLTRASWSAYERPLNWHSVSIDDPLEAFEAPILFISGDSEAKFSRGDIEKLRAYVARGGTILAEPSDHSPAFRASMITLAKAIAPGAALTPVAPEHGIYTVVKRTWKQRPKLLGADDGARTWFFLSEGYLSGSWQRNEAWETDDTFAVAQHLLFYATDLSTLSGRFESTLPSGAASSPQKKTVQVARIRHGQSGAHPQDWDAAAHAWTVMAPYLKHTTGYDVEVQPAVTLDAIGALKEAPALVHLTGRHTLKLSPAERASLRAYVQGGGTVLIDAYAGAPAFATSARAALTDLLGAPTRLDDHTTLASGRFTGGGDLTRGLRYTRPARRLLRQRSVDARTHQLEAIIIDGRPAVIFSAFDLSAAMGGTEVFHASGYKPQSARQILSNIIGHLGRG